MFVCAVDSADTQARGQLWEEYFADPSQWWDNRIDKVWSGVFPADLMK